MHRQSVLVCTQANLAGLVSEMSSHLDTRVSMLMCKNFTIMCYRLSGAYRYYSLVRCEAVQYAIDVITFGTNRYLYVQFFQGSTETRRSLTTGVLVQGTCILELSSSANISGIRTFQYSVVYRTFRNKTVFFSRMVNCQLMLLRTPSK
jgi:hypothetical protein